MVEALDKRGMAILRFLARLEARGDGPPATREVATAAGYKSARSAYVRLEALEEAGLIERGEAPSRKRRPSRLTRRGWEAVGQTPLLGKIAAGNGIEAIASEESYSLFRELLAPGNSKARFSLVAQGDSMFAAHIADGDLLVVEQDEDPPDGAVVAALLPGNVVTVKRLFREGDRIRLKAENDAYEDIVVPGDDLRVQGRVLHVIHPPRRGS